ncbi:MAG: MBL fold metallo-hydrolase, partial [Gammaproteobacteria bacterium]|nr:MBL fold metallo-hydrolase [Gammaproteobacteria bacterium]
PAIAPKADVVVMETTYGDRLHKRLAPSVDELYTAIRETFSRGGNVIIPSFALERTQEILYFLREGRAAGKLPISIQVFLDSPMAISATKIFSRHPECYDDDSAQLFASGEDPFGFPGLHFISDTAQSMALNMFHSGAVIIAGSGMCTGGRVRHHLKHNLWREHCSVVFVGFAAHGTLARKIIDGAERVRIYGEEVSVRASIHTIGGFSAHADQEGLLAWHKQAGSSARTFLVHGEQRAMEAFAAQLDSADVTLPEAGSEYEL